MKDLSALLILDYQTGLGDQAFASAAAQHAATALAAARHVDLPVVFSKVCFQAGYTDVSTRNKAFAPYKKQNLLPPANSQLIPLFQPGPHDMVVNKNRFSAFSGNSLRTILQAAGIEHLVLAGVTTSGVVLATFLAAADEDYALTILSDACADTSEALHEQLMAELFPRSAEVLTTQQWMHSLSGTQTA